MKNQNYIIVYILLGLFVGALAFIIFNFNFSGKGIFTEDKSNNLAPGDKLIELLDTNEVKVEGGLTPIQLLSERQNKARLQKGCFSGKDCIPSIDNPKFVSRSSADLFLEDDDWVIGLERSGTVRAYPLKILNWHEIVNDTVNGEPIAISFCPLCYTGNAFIREIDGEAVEFGVSGYLLNSNLVMYDRKTDSLWSQLTGDAIVGTKTGSELKKITVSTSLWSDWKMLHPSTEVLSTDTGYSRDYQLFPYGDYNSSNEIFFDVENSSDKLPPKEIVYGVIVDDVAKAYPRFLLESKVGDGVLFRDFVGEIAVEGQFNDGLFTLVNTVTREPIVPEIGFWFAWVAFHPNTEVWQ